MVGPTVKIWPTGPRRPPARATSRSASVRQRSASSDLTLTASTSTSPTQIQLLRTLPWRDSASRFELSPFIIILWNFFSSGRVDRQQSRGALCAETVWGQPRLPSLCGAERWELCRAQSEPGQHRQHQRVGHHHLTDCLSGRVRSTLGLCPVLYRDHGDCQQLELRLELPPSEPRLQVGIIGKVGFSHLWYFSSEFVWGEKRAFVPSLGPQPSSVSPPLLCPSYLQLRLGTFFAHTTGYFSQVIK